MLSEQTKSRKMRIDKWLWAARFFKTRSLAKKAIEAGKVQISNQRIKVSREISLGDIIKIRRGWEQLEVVVLALSSQRQSASCAQQLYSETADSQVKRALARESVTAETISARTKKRPDKRQRRKLELLRKQL